MVKDKMSSTNSNAEPGLGCNGRCIYSRFGSNCKYALLNPVPIRAASLLEWHEATVCQGATDRITEDRLPDFMLDLFSGPHLRV